MDQNEHLEILNNISEILDKRNINHYVDPKIKTYDGSKPYLGIYRSPKRLFFTYYYKHDYLQAIAPKKMTPEKIKIMYRIDGEGEVWDKNYKSKTHYVFNIPLRNGKINGKYTLQDRKDFFIDIALAR